MPDPTQRLQVDRLTVVTAAGGQEVLSGISLTVASGEILGLVGESGSGKTTAGLAVLGYVRKGLRITGGQIRVDGLDLLSLGAEQMRRRRGATVSYVPQDPGSALNPALRVDEQLVEVYRAHLPALGRTEISTRIDDLLHQVQLDKVPGVRRAYPHQLSGGQQQRIGIAMAFVCDPAVIVLDEPTTGLDVSTQRHIIDMVRTLCRAGGAAAVYVSHDLAVVRDLADRVAVLYSGRVVEIGDCEQLFVDPQHPYTAGLLAAAPSALTGARLIGMPGSPPGPDSRPSGCVFAPRCPLVIAECTSREPTLAPVGPNGHLARCILPGRTVAVTVVGRTPPATQAAEGAVLQVNELVANYGDKEVLHGVSLDLGATECLAVVGESGSGKSTLGRSIIGLHTDLRGGRIMLEGETLAPGSRARTPDECRRLQYIFQSPYASLNPRRSIEQSLLIPLHQLLPTSAAEARDRAVEALTDVSLTADYLRRYPDELSGGERQRVAIARALIVDPDLLICDEVTSALDVSVQAVVIETLRDLQGRRQLAMLFITHNISLVRSIAQRVAVLSDGHVVESGKTADVTDRPQHPYTQALLRDVPELRPISKGTG